MLGKDDFQSMGILLKNNQRYFKKTYNLKKFSNLSSNSICLHCCEVFRMVYIYWIGKMLWRRAWQPTPVFLPGKSPGMEEPGGLQSLGSQRVRHDWATKHSTHSHMHTYKYILLDYLYAFIFLRKPYFSYAISFTRNFFSSAIPCALYASPVLFSLSLLIPFTVTT